MPLYGPRLISYSESVRVYSCSQPLHTAWTERQKGLVGLVAVLKDHCNIWSIHIVIYSVVKNHDASRDVTPRLVGGKQALSDTSDSA